jgi:hypothetical protein
MTKKKQVVVSNADIDFIERMTLVGSFDPTVEYRDIVLHVIAEVRRYRDKQDIVFNHIRDHGLW